MPIRDILVALDSGASGKARMRLALDRATARKARLTGVWTLPAPRNPPPSVGVGPLATTPPWTLAPPSGPPRNPERAEAAEREFRSQLRAHGVEGEWFLLDQRDLSELIAYANTVDLTILGQQPDEAATEGTGAFAPDPLLVEIAPPVLIVPSAGTFEGVGRRPLLAWDGSREAARALGDALPLIEGAQTTTVIYVGASGRQPEPAPPALDRLVRHLQRHGIAAKVERIPGSDVPISDLLLSRAADLGADLIVAGAYHHSRIREALLGGVSRDLLRHMTVPVLMAH